jgi:hypothetical protein
MRNAMTWTAAPCLVLAVLAGCGESEKAASGRSMAAAAQATARHSNTPPQITRVTLQPDEPRPGTPVQARVEAQDPDGDALQYQFRWSVDGNRVDSNTASLLVPEARKGAAIEVDVIASDGRDMSAPAHAETHVGNRPPSLEGVTLDPPNSVKIGQPLVAVATARDPDGDPIHFRYEWRVNGQPVHEDGDHFSTAGLHRGDRIEARVVASDGQAETPPFDSAAVSVANSPPQITSNPQQVQIQDGTYHYSVEARDPDGDRGLRYKLIKGPAGARIDPVMGEFTWQPTRDQVGTHSIEVSVEDGHGGETHQTFELTVREALAKASDDSGAAPQPNRYNGRARAAAAAKKAEDELQQAPPQLQPPAAAQE